MDMSYVSNRTDQHVLETIKKIQKERSPGRVSLAEVAEHVGCHVNTVLNAIQRLEKRELLKRSTEKGKPTAYEVMD